MASAGAAVAADPVPEPVAILVAGPSPDVAVRQGQVVGVSLFVHGEGSLNEVNGLIEDQPGTHDLSVTFPPGVEVASDVAPDAGSPGGVDVVPVIDGQTVTATHVERQASSSASLTVWGRVVADATPGTALTVTGVVDGHPVTPVTWTVADATAPGCTVDPEPSLCGSAETMGIGGYQTRTDHYVLSIAGPSGTETTTGPVPDSAGPMWAMDLADDTIRALDAAYDFTDPAAPHEDWAATVDLYNVDYAVDDSGAVYATSRPYRIESRTSTATLRPDCFWVPDVCAPSTPVPTPPAVTPTPAPPVVERPAPPAAPKAPVTRVPKVKVAG